jgi:hypothetical protein
MLELQPGGLRSGGSLVTRGNLPPAAASRLGAPTRTNQVAQTGTVIYAYDHQGLGLGHLKSPRRPSRIEIELKQPLRRATWRKGHPALWLTLDEPNARYAIEIRLADCPGKPAPWDHGH